MALIKIVDQINVSPPVNSASNPTVPLSFFDIAWLHTGPVERLFFFPYHHSTSHFLSLTLLSLTSSLSLTLQRFHILTCHVSTPPSDPGQYIFSPSSTNSVTLTVAESDSGTTFEELVSSDPLDLGKLDPLVPQLSKSSDGTSPLAALQVTVFPNQGICIGVSIHHVACDDSASIHFVKSWAAASRDNGFDLESSPLPPIHDRSVIAVSNCLYFKTLSEMRELASNASQPPPPPPPDVSIKRPDLFIGSFSLSREHIDRLKQGVADTAASSGVPVHSSSFTVACAYAWICLLKCQAEKSTKETAHLLFSVDCRARLTPPVPVQYFGNCLRPCFVEASVEDLLKPNGAIVGAIEIGKSIKGLENGALDGAEGWFKKILSILPNQPMSVGGSPRFRVYDVDFGFGKPRKVEMVSIAKTPGTVSLSESGTEEGGIEIGVILPLNEMESFSACFSDGLELI